VEGSAKKDEKEKNDYITYFTDYSISSVRGDLPAIAEDPLLYTAKP